MSVADGGPGRVDSRSTMPLMRQNTSRRAPSQPGKPVELGGPQVALAHMVGPDARQRGRHRRAEQLVVVDADQGDLFW